LRNRGIRVNCFSPGLMTTSGLFRNQQQCADVFKKCKAAVLMKEKAVGWGAGALVYMAIGQETAVRGCEYWRDADSMLGWNSEYGQHFCPVPIESQIDEQTREHLWQLSCQLVGVKNDDTPSKCQLSDYFSVIA
jgi:hypothetical protein